MTVPLTSLENIGIQSLEQVSTAYEAVLLSISLGQLSKFPDRTTRLAIVVALLSEGRVFGFDPDRLIAAGRSAAASHSSS